MKCYRNELQAYIYTCTVTYTNVTGDIRYSKHSLRQFRYSLKVELCGVHFPWMESPALLFGDDPRVSGSVEQPIDQTCGVWRYLEGKYMLIIILLNNTHIDNRLYL